MSQQLQQPKLTVHTGPYLRSAQTTPGVMLDVIIGLVPVIGTSLYFFGLSALSVMLAAVAGCVAIEWLWGPQKPRGRSLFDGTAILTGILLGLTLPPAIPLWMAFLGGIAAIGMGKLIWGGLGHNLFNPALVGRAFLQAAFPTALTTWSAHGDLSIFMKLRPTNLAAPMMKSGVDVVSTATPLAKMKFEKQLTAFMALMVGNTAGSLGETGGLAIIVGGLYLLVRRTFDWRIPASIILTVAIFSGMLYGISPEKYPPPWFMVCSGGLLLGAVFMATDPVTSPLAPKGAWIFGCGIGVLVVLIRLFGGLPEGVMYAILLMNSATPLIERVTQPRAFGRGRQAS